MMMHVTMMGMISDYNNSSVCKIDFNILYIFFLNKYIMDSFSRTSGYIKRLPYELKCIIYGYIDIDTRIQLLLNSKSEGK